MKNKPSTSPTAVPTTGAKGSQKPFFLQRLFILFATLITALHVYAAFSPSALDWGFHHLAFFSLPIKLVWISLALLILLPPTRRLLLHLTETVVEGLSRIPRIVQYVLLTTSWAALCWFARTQWHLLGDGQLLLRDVVNAATANSVPVQFKTEPLAILINIQAFEALSKIFGADVTTTFRVIGEVSGVVFLLALLFFVHRLGANSTERLLLGGFILFAGGSQLFFGYVEDYTILYTVLFSYLVLSYFFLNGRCSLLFPSLAFLVTLALHLSAIYLFPSFFVLLYAQARKEWYQALVALAVTIFLGFVLLKLIGYPPGELVKVLGGGESHLIPLFEVTSPIQNFPLFSWQYLLEHLNLQVLVAPFALLLAAIFVLQAHKGFRWTRPMLLFFTVAALCAGGFVATVNPNLGLSRDWDLFSSYFLPVIVFVVVFYHHHVKFEGKRELLFTAVGLTLLHTIPWVALNADEQKAHARHRVLFDERLWGKMARFTYFEELAVYYRNQKKYAEAVEAYRGYVATDSSNPRIYQSIANVYQLMGDKEQERIHLEEAIRRGWQGAETFTNLGLIVFEKNDVNRAIELTNRGLMINPKLAPGYHNLGVFYYYGRRDCRSALENFEKAMQLDPKQTSAYKGAAMAAYCIRDLEKARTYGKKFLQEVPGDREVLQLLNLLEQRTQESPAQKPPAK